MEGSPVSPVFVNTDLESLGFDDFLNDLTPFSTPDHPGSPAYFYPDDPNEMLDADAEMGENAELEAMLMDVVAPPAAERPRRVRRQVIRDSMPALESDDSDSDPETDGEDVTPEVGRVIAAPDARPGWEGSLYDDTSRKHLYYFTDEVTDESEVIPRCNIYQPDSMDRCIRPIIRDFNDNPDHYKWSVQTTFIRQLVQEMNSWMIFMTGYSKPRVAYRSWNASLQCFQWSLSSAAARDLEIEFQRFGTVPIVNKQDMMAAHSFKPGRKDRQLAVAVNPTIGGKVKKGKLKKKDRAARLQFVSIISVWLSSPWRATKKKLIFDPRPSYFSCPPDPGCINEWDWTKLTYGRETVVGYQEWILLQPLFLFMRFSYCDTDEEFMVILYRFALMMQQPWIKQGVAQAFGGFQGSGKTTPLLIFGSLFGTYFTHLQNQEDLTGTFNGLINRKIFGILDEALDISENNAAVSIMKNLITAKTQRNRRMRLDPEMEDSYLNIAIIANNQDKLVPVDEQERRYEAHESNATALCSTALFTSKCSKLSRPEGWIANIVTSMQGAEGGETNSGLKTLANFLYNLPIPKTWDYRKIFITRQLWRQKMNNIHPVKQWWIMVLLSKRNISFTGEIASITPPYADWNWRIDYTAMRALFNDKYQKLQRMSTKEFDEHLYELLPKTHIQGINPAIDTWSPQGSEDDQNAAVRELISWIRPNGDPTFVLPPDNDPIGRQQALSYWNCRRAVVSALPGAQFAFGEANADPRTTRLAALTLDDVKYRWIPDEDLMKSLRDHTFECKSQVRYAEIDQRSTKDMGRFFVEFGDI